MKRNTKPILLYILALSLLTLGAVALRAYAALTELDVKSGYFDNNLISAASVCVIIIAVLVALSHLFFGKTHVPAPTGARASSYIPAGAMAAVLLFLSVELFLEAAGVGGAAMDKKGLTLPLLLELITAFLGLISTLSFFFSIFYEKRENTRKAAYSIVAALFFASYAALLYFDSSLPINSPVKIADQMAFLFAAVFFLYETRISLGRSLWRAHTAFGMIAAILALYSAVPTLIMLLAKGVLISESLAATVLLVTTAVYSSLRVISHAFAGADEKCTTVKTLESLASKRETELAEGLPHAGYTGNVEIGEEIGENYEIQIPENEGERKPDAEGEASE